MDEDTMNILKDIIDKRDVVTEIENIASRVTKIVIPASYFLTNLKKTNSTGKDLFVSTVTTIIIDASNNIDEAHELVNSIKDNIIKFEYRINKHQYIGE